MADSIIHNNALCQTCNAAWLAGLIDGEGCLGIRHAKGRDGKPRWFRPVITIGMTSEAACQKALEIAGKGTICRYTRKNKAYKAVWAWQVSCGDAAEVAQLIRPLLVVKQQQADLLIQLDALNKSRKKNNSPLQESEVEERLSLKIQIHNLNRPS